MGKDRQQKGGRQRRVAPEFSDRFLGDEGEDDVSRDRSDQHNRENEQQRGIYVEGAGHMLRFHDDSAQQEKAVPVKEIPSQLRIRHGNAGFDAQPGAQQRLMNGGADAEREHCEKKVSPLVRGINPAQHEQQHQHHPGHAKQ